MSTPSPARLLLWRSLLFVPAKNGRFIEKAHTRGADAIILDLEDSVPAGERPDARRTLMESVELVARGGADVLVRINAEPEQSTADLDAAVHAGVRALLRDVRAETMQTLSGDVSRLEVERGMVVGSVGFVVLVESAAGLLHAEAIAHADPRNLALELGGEDFALSTGMVPDAETLALPKQMALYAARAAGLVPLGILGSIADYADVGAYRAMAEQSRRLGFEGAACIHPSNVPILNEVFTPSAAQAAHARRVIDAYADAQRTGSGAVSVDGKMVDVPVVERAQTLLARLEAIRAREAGAHS